MRVWCRMVEDAAGVAGVGGAAAGHVRGGDHVTAVNYRGHVINL
jgi:hypothetical protein